MIKEYELPDGGSFKTITLPSGTVLFRGINYHSSTNKYGIFSDLLGYYGEDGFRIAPTHNVFFYPVPYISDSVSEYNLHSIYLTNYEIELALLIRPSTIHRASSDGPTTRCSDISSIDKCGHDMKPFDPCLKESILELYPQIAGFIAIAEKDSEHFLKLYKRLLHKKKYSKLRHILPSIVTNSRDLISVPEIVIYPLHKRDNECNIIRSDVYDIKSATNYCIRNIAKFNYFPLLYVNENGVYTFTDLNENLLNKIRTNERIKMGPDNEIFHIMNRLMNRLLSPTGYRVNGVPYRFSIDIRTGYFIANTSNNSIRSNKTVKNASSSVRLYNDDKSIKVPFDYSLANKAQIMNMIGIEQVYDLDELEKTVNKNGYSITNKYILNKGNKSRMIQKLELNKVLDRHDIVKEGKNKTRKLLKL